MKNTCNFRNVNRQKLANYLLCMLVLVAFFACNKKGDDIINEEDIVKKEETINKDGTIDKEDNTDEEEIIDGVKCSELGMIPNDDTKGVHNRNILIDALKDGTTILVDDKYYLTGLGTPTKVDSDIVIAGITDNAELCFTKTTLSGSSNFVRVASANLLMRKIRFTTNKDEALFAFRLSDAHKMETMRFEKCYFEGPIRLISWGYTGSVIPNPETNDYGIDNFKFNDNTCKNISTTLIMIHNVPVKHSQIMRNEIRNFSNIFYNQERSNDNPNGAILATKMEYLEVKDNTVINDVSWDGKEQDKDHMYHCFIFFEGNNCEYKNNHVEGLHVIDEEVVVYDGYFSCINLEYENNYWKNNITFHPTYTEGRQLMKCKGGAYIDSYRNVKRVCRNNTFIVEKSYAEKLGRNPDELWVKIIEFQSDMNSVVVEKNKIDVYVMRLNTADVKTHNFTFSNNDIHAVKTLNSGSNCVLPITTRIEDGVHGDYIARDNKIVIDEPGSTPITNNSLIRYTFPNKKIDHTKVTFENNHVKWPDLQYIVSAGYTANLAGAEISIKGNTIISESVLVDRYNINGSIDKSDNTFTTTSN